MEGVWNCIVENQVVCSCANEKVESNTDDRDPACEVSQARKNSITAILGHLEPEPKDLHDLGNSKISERCFSEGSEMMVHQKPKALILTINALHNQYLHVNLFGKNGKNVLLCDTLYLPVPPKNGEVMERQERCGFFCLFLFLVFHCLLLVCVFFCFIF